MKTKKHILKKACGKGGPAMGPYGRMSYPSVREVSAPLENKPTPTMAKPGLSVKRLAIAKAMPAASKPKVTVGAVAKEIPGTLWGMAKNLKKAVDPGNISGKILNKVGDSVEGVMRKNEAFEKWKQENFKRQQGQ